MPLLVSSKHGSFQEFCSLELERCVLMESKSGGSGRSEWELAKSRLLKLGPRIVIADIDLSRRNLKGFDFSRCYFSRVIFRLSDLSGAIFRQAICRETNFTQAFLTQADLSLIDLRGCELNFATPVSEMRGVRPWLAEKIEIAQYRFDHTGDTPNRILKKWYEITRFGTSARWLAAASSTITIVFGCIFYSIQNFLHAKIFTDRMDLLTAIEYSALTFLNASPNLETTNGLIILAVITEVVLGLLILAIFFVSLTRRLVVYR